MVHSSNSGTPSLKKNDDRTLLPEEVGICGEDININSSETWTYHSGRHHEDETEELEQNRLRYDARLQTRTQAEKTLLKMVLGHGLKANQSFDVIVNQFIGRKGRIAKPDLLLLKYGYVLDLDGNIHNREFKMGIDYSIETSVYDELNLHCLRIPNAYLYNERDLLWLKKMLSKIFSTSLTTTQCNQLRVALSEGRKSLDWDSPDLMHAKQAAYGSARARPTLWSKDLRAEFLGFCTWTVENGGFRIRVRCPKNRIAPQCMAEER